MRLLLRAVVVMRIQCKSCSAFYSWDERAPEGFTLCPSCGYMQQGPAWDEGETSGRHASSRPPPFAIDGLVLPDARNRPFICPPAQAESFAEDEERSNGTIPRIKIPERLLEVVVARPAAVSGIPSSLRPLAHSLPAQPVETDEDVRRESLGHKRGLLLSAAAGFAGVIAVLGLRALMVGLPSEHRQPTLQAAEQAVLLSVGEDDPAVLKIADQALERGDWGLARDYYAQALHLNLDSPRALLGLADVEWRVGNLDQAQRIYGSLSERYPDRPLPPRVEERARPLK